MMRLTRRQFLMGILGEFLAAPQQLNADSQGMLGEVSRRVGVAIVTPNNPPIYSGPTSLDMVVGMSVNFAQYLLKPDGKALAFSMDASSLGSIDANGVFTPRAAGTGTITIYVDDGNP